MTAIPFVEKAWPIVTGCDKIKAGCRECYASRLAATRLKHHRHYRGLAEYRDGRGHWIAPPRFNEDILDAPLRWSKKTPRRVFVAHTGDLFHEAITADQIMDVWDTMSMCPQHVFLVFTKRWSRAQSLLLKHAWQIRYSAVNGILPNVHLVFSASTQAEVDECAKILLDTPAAKRGLSLEPLLEHVDLMDCERDYLPTETYHDAMSTGDGTGIKVMSGLDFIIAGGETSLKKALARPCPVRAARSLRDQCQETSVPFWWKGWGAHLPGGQIKGRLDGVKYEEM